MINIEETIVKSIESLSRIPAQLESSARRSFSAASAEIVRIMGRPVPRRRNEKVDWDSDVQRVAYYASGGFGHGVPYDPTGGAEAAWQHQAISNGHMVANIGHKAVFLYGTATGVGKGGKTTATGQSRIHAGRRRVFRVVADSVIAKLPERVLQILRIEVGK